MNYIFGSVLFTNPNLIDVIIRVVYVQYEYDSLPLSSLLRTNNTISNNVKQSDLMSQLKYESL